ncbi:DUF3857 domain-containing protein [Winogradskyella ursingii]|uniref:DUF3857 domain-containing protein n=1 Tax=Winogradskyella ursingii TaxID=2686079 RepID=UPI0015C800EE|nr:DUF3857 domain-containing protein [Winogradskyella ursingii]
MKFHLLFLAVLYSAFTFSQDYNISMMVSRNDLESNSYIKDSTANALIIYDHGNSFIDEDTFWLRFQLKQKIKILKQEGIEKGTFTVRLYKGKSSEEKIKNIKATTYNLENGKIVRTKLEESAIFREENENFTLVKIVLPKVKVGSVLTIEYEKQSRFVTKFQPWYFQGYDPVLYSEYNTSIPANYEYNIKLVGTKKFDTFDNNIKKNCITVGNGGRADCSIAKYVMKDIPAYKPESFTTTPLNYLARIEYELSVIKRFDGGVEKIAKTWANVDDELKTDSDFGRQLSKRSLVRKLLPEAIIYIADPLAKAQAIYQYVLDNYKWNEKYERYDVSVKDLIDTKLGSVFEINLLLENLLSSENFEVYPVLLSTRSSGFITKVYPVITEFNYVVVKTIIDGKTYFLDATSPYIPFGTLPFRCLNQYGRLMDFDNNSYWEDIKVEDFSVISQRVKLELADDMFKGSINSSFSGYHANSLKQEFDENSVQYKKNMRDDHNQLRIIKHDIVDFKKSANNFTEDIEFEIDPEFIGNKIYFNPFVFKFFDENPFQLQERTYPIDFGYKDIYSYAMSLKLPENFKIADIPEPISYSLPNSTGSFMFNVNLKRDELTVYFKIKFNEPIYGFEYYPYLKEFMKKVVETQKNTVIVLEKQ